MSFAVNLLLMVVMAAGLRAEEGPAERDWIWEVKEIKDKEIDKRWREYVDKLGGEYEEVLKETPKNDEDDPKYLQDFLDWHPASPLEEIPYLAVLYVNDLGPSDQYKEFFKGEPDPVTSHIEPHKACGGALISPSHVLTVCGCLSYLISELVLDIPGLFKFYDKTPKFRLMSQIGGSYGLKPPSVKVHFSYLRFIPHEEHEIDTDSSKWITDTELNCNNIIKTHASTPDLYLRSRRADGNLVIAPFKPRSKQAEIYVKWPPPVPINEDTDPQYEAFVRIASIGMRVTEKTKIKFYSSISTSALNMKHCNFTSAACDKKVFPDRLKSPYFQLGKTHTCFCSVTADRPPQLVGGVIGWPAMDKNGNLLGLTATERSPSDGTLVVAVITERIVSAIETYIGNKTLMSLHQMPNAYREQELKDKFLVYDYSSALYVTTKPKAGATNLRITFFHSFLPFFVLPNFV